MIRLRFFALFLALGGLSLAEDLDVRTALSRPVLNPNQATMEVQVYTGSRVPAIAAKSTPAEWTNYADRLRKEALERVILRGEARRWSDFKGRVEWQDTIEGPGYRVRKLRYEVVPGLWTPALLYEPSTLSGKAAAVLNVNGHDPDGNATNYIQERCINLAKRGLLAPSMWSGLEEGSSTHPDSRTTSSMILICVARAESPFIFFHSGVLWISSSRTKMPILTASQ